MAAARVVGEGRGDDGVISPSEQKHIINPLQADGGPNAEAYLVEVSFREEIVVAAALIERALHPEPGKRTTIRLQRFRHK